MCINLDIENIRYAVKAEIITTREAFAAMRAVKTDDYSIIKELHKERYNGKTLAAS